ncbi:MAG TPA: arginase family protein [Candidatus Elarobacter sp.]|nr:arginase family protein [Candidatus Elarobacter sp.]HEV2736940.1 arginase family protein [Candidatus Elarobacter sp.]
MSRAPAPRARRIVVPYHHAEPLPKLAGAFPADDAVVVSKGPAREMLLRLYDQVAARVASSAMPAVVASGDCTTSLAVVAGLQRRGLAPSVIWLDAHGDFHTPHTTRSGYFGGMALAMLVGRTGTSLAESIGLRAIAEDACVLAGARDLDPAERDALDASAVHRVAGVAALARAALPPPPWYVHLDIDVIDPSELPPLRFPAPGGPSANAVATALRALASRGTIAALGLACTLTPKAFEQPDALATIAPLIDATFG